MTYELSLQSIEPVTHDTNRLQFERPPGLDFRPGQATEMALLKEGWEDEKRPFTFTSLPDDDVLEFVIKSYPSHNGVTEQIAKLAPGDKVVIEEPWGAIENKGPGTIIAGGAGITPFIAILRAQLAKTGTLKGFRLIFSNKCERDIILRDAFLAMPGLQTDFVLTEEQVSGRHYGKIDSEYLDRTLSRFDEIFYLCGPPEMEDDIACHLEERGVSSDRLVREDG